LIKGAAGKGVSGHGWKRIEAEEEWRGVLLNKEREKVVDIQEMMKFVESDRT
jgi:hypothetical protein